MFEKIILFDKEITLRLNSFKNNYLTPIIKFFAFFGQEPVWLGILAFFLFIWYDPNIFLVLGGNLLAGIYLVVPLKYIIKRKRPFQQIDGIIFLDRPQISPSFPSWHCYNIISMSCAIIFLLNLWILIPFLVIISFLVCFSRIYLGSHYFIDVIFGIVLGFLGFLISISTAPLWLILVLIIESLIIFPIAHQDWVTAIFTQWWYLLLVILVYSIIFINTFYSLKLKGRKKN